MLQLPRLLPIVLVPGGLYDDPPMTGQQFWVATGVAPALARLGVEFTVHERPAAPRSWTEEAEALEQTIATAGHDRVGLVAGSNGCSAALRLVVDRPQLVERVMLCWPATAGDPVIDELARVIIDDTHGSEAVDALLAGSPVRGVSETELASIDIECVVHPSMPANKIHQRSTVIDLLAAVPGAFLVGGSPEPPDAGFADFVDSLAATIAAFSRIEPDD